MKGVVELMVYFETNHEILFYFSLCFREIVYSE